MRRIWRFFSSVYLTVVLAALVCAVAVWGSILSARYPQFFRAFDQEVLLPFLLSLGPEYLGLTAWVWALIVLTGLFGVNAVVCTIDKVVSIIANRKPLASLFAHIVHVGFLIALLGHLVGSVYGFRSFGNVVFKGDSIRVPHSDGLLLRLDDTQMTVGPRGELDSLRTSVTLHDGKGSVVASGEIGMNSPLIHKGVAFYHFDQGQSPSGLVLDAGGRTVEAELEGSFAAADGRLLSLGEIYPDFAVGADGQPYNRSREFSNPHIEITWDGGRAYLPIATPGASVAAGGLEIRLVDYVYSPYVVFTINKDPGIGFIIAGSIVLVAGMVLLLFFRGERAELVRTRPSRDTQEA